MLKVAECEVITAYSNGGSLEYGECGRVKLLSALNAYVNEDSLANILSMKDVKTF